MFLDDAIRASRYGIAERLEPKCLVMFNEDGIGEYKYRFHYPEDREYQDWTLQPTGRIEKVLTDDNWEIWSEG